MTLGSRSGPLSARSAGWSKVRLAAWTIGVALALSQAVVYRDWVNGDAISYLDMSDAIPTGDWSRLVNATWSPLYPALLGSVAALTRPSAEWQFPMAHLVNFLCFLFAFVSFEFLLRAMLDGARDDGDGGVPFPRRDRLIVGYALFLWASLGMLTLMKPTPDMLMSGFLYLALGFLLRIKHGRRDLGQYAWLGLVLGLGYLAKAIMFPLGLMMLAMAAVVGGGLRRSRSGTAVAVAAFVLVAAPYAAQVSKLAGRRTFGEAGTVVHLTFLDRVTQGIYWQGAGGATGALVHPPRKISDAPPAYEFQRPLAVTYPLWYDPYYWAEGVRPSFEWHSQARMLLANLTIFAKVLAGMAGLAAVLVVLWLNLGARRSLGALLAYWPLWLVGAAALGAYATLHVETRYIGAFFVLVWLALLYGARIPTRLSPWVGGAMAGLVVLNLALLTGREIRRDLASNLSKTRLNDYEASLELRRMGVAPGDRVARISPWVSDGWARLARVSVIAEVQKSRADEFWRADGVAQRRVLEAFAAAGAKAVVSVDQGKSTPAGWKRLGKSPYVAMLLPAVAIREAAVEPPVAP